MRPVAEVVGRVVPIWRSDIDTDQIMPKQFLAKVDRGGFGEAVFHTWRQEPDFELDDPTYADANILLTAANFGSGSSREQAAWGIQQYGFDAIVAPSFSDIFRANCRQIGLLTCEAPEDECRKLLVSIRRNPSQVVKIRLQTQEIFCDAGVIRFEISAADKHMLLEGLDDIALMLAKVADLEAYEASREDWRPSISWVTSR